MHETPFLFLVSNIISYFSFIQVKFKLCGTSFAHTVHLFLGSQLMNGILAISLDSGILLHSSPNLSDFGFQENGIDPMQLSATIFALYKAASSKNFPEKLTISSLLLLEQVN